MRERAGHGGRSYFRKFTLGSYADLAAAGCASVQPLALPRTATTVRPCYAGETAPPTMISEAPEARVVAIDGASVHGEHDLVSTGGRAVLEMAEHPGFDRFNYLSGAVPFMDRNEVVVHSLRRHPANVGQAFWLGGLGSSNYFHWVVEFLPRLMGFEGHVPTGLPLLLDERTAAVPQLMEALAACLERVPEVVRIKRMARCDVGRLWTATHPSWLPFDYRPDCGLEATDQRLSDAALRWVRERLRTAAGASARCGRRLYVPRAGTKFRRIVNEHELGALLQEHGFESVHPERLGALEQVRTFAQADVIVAPSGAALTNVLFASPGARLVCLLPEAWREFSVYSTLAAVAGVSSRFVGGQVVAGSFPIPYQCDYWVDMGQLREALAWAA
jgi:capsular polysaccharide biosynthesis protein